MKCCLMLGIELLTSDTLDGCPAWYKYSEVEWGGKAVRLKEGDSVGIAGLAARSSLWLPAT